MATHIGTSGWSYDHWQEILYPHGGSSKKRLAHYCKRFKTVEVNSTFYGWPPDDRFADWRTRVPEDFVFSIKAPRILTHQLKLHDPEAWITRIRSALRRLGKKLGVLLVQLPPSYAIDLDRLAHFLKKARGLKLAIEPRHPSWHVEPFFALLEQHEAAYCIMSGPKHPLILRATAPFVYVRLHDGSVLGKRSSSNYSEEALQFWARAIQKWEREDRDVFAYFNNDAHGYAVHNAETLLRLVGQEPGPSALSSPEPEHTNKD